MVSENNTIDERAVHMVSFSNEDYDAVDLLVRAEKWLKKNGKHYILDDISFGSDVRGSYLSLYLTPVESMGKIPIRIEVWKSEPRKERLNRVSRVLDTIGEGERAEIVSDDEVMLKAAPKMIGSLGKAKFIQVWKGDDSYFHTLVEKKLW